MNLLDMGYTFLEYVNFIIRRIEILSFIPGVLLLLITMRKRRDIKK